MSVFLVRLGVILLLFLLGALVSSLTGQNALAVPIWFIGITAWTLILNFRKALFIVVPFLLIADILWDGRVGPVFLGGFLLATGTTYLAVRIEAHSWWWQTGVYSLLISCFSILVIWVSTAHQPYLTSLPDYQMLGEIFLSQLVLTGLFITPLTRLINHTESWHDTSYREQYKKIR